MNSPRDDAKDGPHNAALAAAKKLLEENKEELNTHAEFFDTYRAHLDEHVEEVRCPI